MMIRRIVALSSVLCSAFAGAASAQQHVSGYTRDDGTVVGDYYRNSPSASSSNYSGPSVGLDSVVTFDGGASAARTIVVGGYYRKDGTYVEPHLRTVPDGVGWNNLSYKEDADQPGRPPSAYTPGYFDRFPFVRPASLADQEERIREAAELEQLGTALDWQRHSAADLAVYLLRARKAKALESYGVRVDWRRVPYYQLADMECSARARKDLTDAGVAVTAEGYSCAQLDDVLRRVQKAKAIAALGKTVDWREHSLDELVEIEAKLELKRH